MIQDEIIEKRNKIIDAIKRKLSRFKQPELKNTSRCWKQIMPEVCDSSHLHYSINSYYFPNCYGVDIIIGEFKNLKALGKHISYTDTKKLNTIILNCKITTDISTMCIVLDHELTHLRDHEFTKNIPDTYHNSTDKYKYYNQESEFNAHYICGSIHYSINELINTEFYKYLNVINKKRLLKKLYKYKHKKFKIRHTSCTPSDFLLNF